jgi:CheY-like chemotaxis protein
VDISWRVERNGHARRFQFEWRESGGPPVTTPTRKGFGSTVLNQMTRMAFYADAQQEFSPEGLVWRFTCDLTHIIADEPLGTVASSTTPGLRSSGRRVLVVEDDALVALDVASTLEAAGFEVIGPAASVAKAIELIERVGCDGAVLDVNLGSETAVPIALRLLQLNTPFIALSGYSRDQLPDVFDQAPHMQKPHSGSGLVSALRTAMSVAVH